MLTKNQLMRELDAFSNDYSFMICSKGQELWFDLIGHCLQSARLILRHRCTADDRERVCRLLNRVQKLMRICGYNIMYFNYLTGEFE